MNRQRPPPRSTHHPAVPKTHHVRPGAAVNIVLKADQPTGRTVSGTVQDVLTRGNHPRGIKVRLADGRVGRVQSMAGGSSASSGATSAGDPGGVVEGMRAMNLEDATREEARGGEGSGMPAQQIGLEAFIKEAKPKSKRKAKAKATASSLAAEEESTPPQASAASPKEMATCPVCGEFEGDEAAVSHHVAGHFDADQ
ncbi:unnamed protein product [Discula destructiva]